MKTSLLKLTSLAILSAALAAPAVAQIKSPTGSTRLIGPGFDQIVNYEDHGDYGIVEGDIHIPLNKPAASIYDTKIAYGLALGTQYYRWPDGIVHYRFRPDASRETRDIIYQAIAHIEEHTGVNFIEIFNAQQYHVLITDITDEDNGCYADIGYQVAFRQRRGVNYQSLNLNRNGCTYRGVAIHELLHTLGMWHEQARPDRDNYVTIIYGNIIANKRHNFGKREDAIIYTPYDYDSIMHYGTHGFSISPTEPTILPKNPDITIGKRQAMSQGDIYTINAIYPDNAPPPPPPPRVFMAQSLVPVIGYLLLDANAIEVGDNGKTIVCASAPIGHKATVDGVEYTVVDNDSLRALVNKGADVTNVCTSRVTNMYRLFYDATDFNQDISHWDVSRVTTMRVMFRGAEAFNQDISRWNVSKVTSMAAMFTSAAAFNQDIGGWKVGAVRDMQVMFSATTAFNQDIGGWDVGAVKTMRYMFWGASAFNQDLGNWDVSEVTRMYAMFGNATAFSQDLSRWKVAKVNECEFFSYRNPRSWTADKMPNFTACDP